jgi:hypothetical protein
MERNEKSVKWVGERKDVKIENDVKMWNQINSINKRK